MKERKWNAIEIMGKKKTVCSCCINIIIPFMESNAKHSMKMFINSRNITYSIVVLFELNDSFSNNNNTI